MNPLFNLFGGNQMQMPNNPVGNAFNMMQQLNQFRQNFRGDPKEQVQNLLNSGQVSQEQYNQAFQQAQYIGNFLGLFK